MGLAVYGDPKVFQRQFQSLMRVGEEDYWVDPDLIGFSPTKFNKLETVLGPPRYPDAQLTQQHAPTLQRHCRKRPMP
jgi:hypothetical protein